MNLQDLEAFVAVAETGSVNRAAERLNLTQPATTRRIQNFEANFDDGPLFDRSVKPAVLTTLGNHVLEHCRQVLTSVSALEACGSKTVDPAGDLKAGVAHGLGEIILTSPLDGLRRQYSRIRLRVSSDWTATLIETVRNGALDCAIGLLTSCHVIPEGLTTVPLGAEQVLIVGAADRFPRHDRSRWRIRDLADEAWFLNPAGCGCRAALVKSFNKQGLAPQIAAEIFGEDLQLSLIARGGGLGLAPRRQIEQSPYRDRLRILEIEDFKLPATVTLFRKTAPGRFDKVIETLVAEIRASLSASSL